MLDNRDLYDYAENNSITVDLRSIPLTKAMSVNLDNKYYIALDEKAMENSAEERTLLAHELGHCSENAMYYMYSPRLSRIKHEATAERWAIMKLISKDEFIELLKNGYSQWDLAEYFNVTDEYIIKAYNLYCNNLSS